MPSVQVKQRVLLVDDDRDYLESMKLQLEAEGYEVTTAESRAEGTQRFEELKPDLAIIDLMLEEPDGGFTLCYQIKKIGPETPVIMVSNVASETGLDFDAKTTEERQWIKADAWLPKPVRLDQLKREIQRVMKKD